ncbi:MAG: CCA tRNA nucleotidyltransferase [Acidobacteria bacterium]|nr:CCA tRNA nucleotidyltransferase [Acidobacteriota bacterium]
MNDDLALRVLSALRAAGHQAYLVGGCVRDLLLGQTPKDFDIATSARPEQITALFPHSDLVGAHFGVVLVKEPGAAVEVATFRTEGPYDDGRHPAQVALVSDPRLDAQRRDFTINALFLDPTAAPPPGRVLDFFHGLDDLARGILRCVGAPRARFQEDHLRLLRAARFAARLGFIIEPETYAAMRAEAPSLARIAAERIRDELTRILTQPHPGEGLRLLDATGLLPVVLPEVKRLQGVQQPPEFHPEGDVWTHTLLMLDSLPADPSPTLAWGVLLHDIGKPATFSVSDRIRFNGHVEAGLDIARGMLSRLRFSGDDTEQILSLVANHMRFGDIHRMKDSTLKRFLRLPRFDEHLALHQADCLSSHGHLDNYHYALERLAATPPHQLRPARLLTGADLLALGYPQGPLYREILTALETAQLDGELTTREAAVAFVRSRWPQSV